MTQSSGVTVLDLASARHQRPDLVEPSLGSLVPVESSADLVGTFVHVAEGVVVADPLQTFFGRDAERMSPDNRTLIVAAAGSSIEYIEGCSAPIYTREADRSSIVEIVVGESASVRHTTIQNWSTNVNSSVIKSATVAGGGHVEWVDAALGSSATTTRISSLLSDAEASASVLSFVSVGAGQSHDAEVCVTHEAPKTTSTVWSKLLGADDGSIRSRHTHRMGPSSEASGGAARCETLRLGGDPDIGHVFDPVNTDGVDLEATDRRIDERHLRYLMQRGLSRSEALGMMVVGFLDPIARTLPIEYAVEWERAIQLGLDRAIG